MESQGTEKEGGAVKDAAAVKVKGYDDKYCYICDISFTSMQHAIQHINGLKHKKRASQSCEQAQVMPQFDFTVWYRCDVCNINCNSQYHLDQHQKGTPHKKKAQRAAASMCFTPIISGGLGQSPIQSSPETLVIKTPTSLLNETETIPSDTLVVGLQISDSEDSNPKAHNETNLSELGQIESGPPAMNSDEKDTLEGVNDKENDLGASLHTDIIPKTESQISQQHAQTTEEGHLESQDKKQETVKTYDEKCCYICNIQFTSLQHANQHINGLKHKKRVSQSCGQAQTLLDSTVWYHCDICNVSCNSQYHLEQHQSGTPHKKKVQTMVSVRGITEHTHDEFSPELTRQSSSTVHSQVQRSKGRNNQSFQGSIADVTIFKAGIPVSLRGQKNTVADTINADDDKDLIQQDVDMGMLHQVPSVPYDGDDETKLKQVVLSDECTKYGEEINACVGNKIQLKTQNDMLVLLDSDPNSTTESKHALDIQPSLASHVEDELNSSLKKLSVGGDDVGENDDVESYYVDSDGNTQCVYEVDPEGRGKCFICNIELDSKLKTMQHIHGKNHKKQLSRAKHGILMLRFVLGPFGCAECQMNFSGPESRAQHLVSEKHKAKVSQSQTAPERTLPPPVKEVFDSEDPYFLTKTMPRGYQIELYETAMTGDYVVFLPTGTGKTIISAMVVSHMLQLNPARPVVFLVDRVLLVVQQSKVLKTQLGDKTFLRIDDDGTQKRSLKIGTLCGEKQDTGGVLLWKQDIIVTTAAYYLNLLEKGVLRWQDLSLAVFDEAHHCTKSHPFNRLLKEYHVPLPNEQRPKILGLTASPAGKSTVPDTEIMLWKLLGNIGDGKLAAILEDSPCFNELSKYKTNTKLIAKEISLSVTEVELQNELQNYLFLCYLRLTIETDISQAFSYREEVNSNQDLGGDVLKALKESLQCAKPNESDRNIFIEALRIHSNVICEALSSVGDGSVEFAFKDLQELLHSSHAGSFDKAAELRLPYEKLKRMTEDYAQRSEEEKKDDKLPVGVVAKEILQGIGESRKQGNKEPLVLVLVKTRVAAQQLTEALKEREDLVAQGISPVCIVGHGGGGGSEASGMNVKKQSRALEGIKNSEYQVVVATSVAEEGVDFPECELVIHMNPPSSVTALVQTRGRARKQGVSHFIALCREPGQKERIEQLQEKEENMYKAVKKIIDKNKQALIIT